MVMDVNDVKAVTLIRPLDFIFTRSFLNSVIIDIEILVNLPKSDNPGKL